MKATRHFPSKRLFLSLFFLSSFAAAAAQVPDVAGIKLGDTEAQALGAAKSYFGKQVTDKGSFVDEKTKVPIAFTMEPTKKGVRDSAHNLVTVALGYNKRVQYVCINRSYFNDKENRPSFDNFSDAVLGKFDKPSVIATRTEHSLIAYWFYNEQMQKIPGNEVPNYCKSRADQQGEKLFDAPNVARPKCPIALRLQIGNDYESRDLVHFYEVSLFDEPGLMSDIQADKDAEQRKREADSAAGRSKKPTL